MEVNPWIDLIVICIASGLGCLLAWAVDKITISRKRRKKRRSAL